MFKLSLASLPLFMAESQIQGVKSGALGEWLVQAAAAAVLVMVFWNLWDRMKGGTPQKREVSFSTEFVTVKQWNETHGRISRERKEIDAQITEMKRDAKERRDALDLSLREIDGRIDDIPERIIKLLKDSRDYHASSNPPITPSRIG